MKRGFLDMDKIKIHGGKSFDLGRQGQFTAFEVEVLSPYSARFYGESENLHVTFTENIEGKPLDRLLNSNWDQLDLEKKQKTAPEVM
jgi:phage head maturation protease